MMRKHERVKDANMLGVSRSDLIEASDGTAEMTVIRRWIQEMQERVPTETSY